MRMLDAQRDLASCVEALQRGPIPVYLDNSELILKHVHEQENPFLREADRILREEDEPARLGAAAEEPRHSD